MVRSLLHFVVVVGMFAACSPPAHTDAGDVSLDNSTFDIVGSDGAETLPDAIGDRTGDGSPCGTDLDCDDGTFCNGAERCMPGSAGSDGRGCIAASPSTPCASGETCDESMRRCIGGCTADADHDGHHPASCGGDDCDDTDPNRFPGNPEICDAAGHDEDCDPSTLGPDHDADGSPATNCCDRNAAGTLVCGTDCDDTSMDINVGAPEVCDGLDDDCDGMIDEGVRTTFFHDLDGDGYGDNSMTRTACSAPSGYVLAGGDCDDMRASVHPGAPDVCDPAMVDDDCNGTPNDPPGGCACTTGATQMCPAPGACAAGMETCVSGVWSACSVMPVSETCNGADDDCDGTVDNGVTRSCFPDADRDGFAARGAAAVQACSCASGFTARDPSGQSDCDDTSNAVYPGAAEICNHRDDNCDGMVDEGVAVNRYVDADGDGYGAGTAMQGCAGDVNTASVGGDCRDDNPNAHPGQSAYFAAPAGYLPCPPMTLLCTDSMGMPRCRDFMLTCDRSAPATGSWDYDCNGSDDPQPSLVCAGGVCGSPLDCPGSGFVYSPGSAACGQDTPRGGCGCNGDSMCQAVTGTTTAPLPCR